MKYQYRLTITSFDDDTKKLNSISIIFENYGDLVEFISFGTLRDGETYTFSREKTYEYKG